MDFEAAVEIILKEEGGYVNDPVDRGGETKYGISKRAYPNIDIRNLTKDRAKELYRLDYWERLRLDELPAVLRLPVFDFAVNAGARQAVRTLQGVAGVKRDGKIGPVTIAASARVTIEAYTEAREMYYRTLVRQRPIQGRFLAGWLARAGKVAALAGRKKSALEK